MATFATPQIRELTPEESRALLKANQVGRIAFALHDRVDIQPIGYICEDEWIFGRTSAGSKLTTLMHNPWCAFETDVVTDLFTWSSVVVKGTFSLLDPKLGSLHTYQRAERALLRLVPGSFSDHDPAPHRSVLFGVYTHEVSGRSSHR